MPDDAADPDSSPDPSSTDDDRDRYVQQWNALCEELGTSDPNEVLARVQTLKRRMERTGEQERSTEGLVTISEVEEVFRDMNEKLEKLRERNAALAQRLEEGSEGNDAYRELYQKTEQLLESLDATTIDEAHERIRHLDRRLESLYREKEQLVQAGLSDAEEALDTVERLETERNTLRRERDQLQEELEATTEPSSSSSVDPDTSVLEAAVVIRDRIGVSSPAEAESFAQVTNDLYDRVQAWAASYGVVSDESPDDVVDILHSMASHLDALPAPNALPPDAAEVLGVTTTSEAHTLATTARRVGRRILEHYDAVELEAVDPEADDALSLLHAIEDQLQALPPSASPDGLPPEAGDILGIRTVDDARELEDLIEDLSSRLNRLREKHEPLEEAGLSAKGALTMIENMEAQLADLYHHAESSANGRAQPTEETGLAALDDALAHRIHTLIDLPEEAEEDLVPLLRALVDRLDERSAARPPLREADIDPTEAVALIESMEAQLNDLYRQKEEQQDAADRLVAVEEILDLSSIEDADDMIPSMEGQLADLYKDKESLHDLDLGDLEQQSPAQQLEALYADRQKLQRTLGISSADDVIEMIESLNSQLEDVYTGRDAEVDPAERHDARLWAPESPPPEPADAPAEESASSETDTLTMNSMEHQLEALYRERETLLHHGLSSAEEAVHRLQTQQRQIDALQRETHTYEQQLDRLESELGTRRVPRIVELVRALESDADTSLDDLRPEPAASPESTNYGVDIGATSPFVDADTLDRLDDMTAEELAELDVGAVRLREDGTVEDLNETALQLPGLRSVEDPTEVIGKNFFLDLAPSTNNNLFFGRFRKGQRRGDMDARFPYTFTSPEEGPQSFAVHLYRPADSDATWLLFRPA